MDKKDRRINLRVAAEDEELLRAAASSLESTLSAFILDAAKERALKVIDDRRWIHLSEQDFEALQDILDHRDPMPKLAQLLARPAVFDSDRASA